MEEKVSPLTTPRKRHHTGNLFFDMYDMMTDSYLNAELLQSNLDADIIEFEKAWNAPRVRHLLNNLCSYEDAVYFEAGVAAGSSYISALYKNYHATSYSCDIFLEKKCGPNGLQQFVDNVDKFRDYLPDPENQTLFPGDCWKVPMGDFFKKRPNVFFYDAGHSKEDHTLAMTHFLPILDDYFIMIIDDWNDDRVMKGTMKGMEVMMEKKLGSILTYRDLHAFPHHAQGWKFAHTCTVGKDTFGDQTRWGNGILMLIIENALGHALRKDVQDGKRRHPPYHQLLDI